MASDLSATLFIDGQWRAASSGRTFAVTDPASGRVLAHAAAGERSDAEAAVAAAAAAFAEWSRTTAYERAEVLLRAYRLMLERADDLARTMTSEQGKPLRAARTEVGYAADFLLWFAEEAKRLYGRIVPSARPDQRFLVTYDPVGVVGAITPWNYPVSMITRKVAPALAAGCCIVLKPAEQTPLTAVAVFRILEEAGLPAGVANLVTAEAPEPIGVELVENDAVAKITFTGSTAVGRRLAGAAASRLKRYSLELGGHAPFLVFDDADPVHAAKGAAMVKVLNTGQACISPNRIFVQRASLEPFLEAMVARLEKMRVGPGAAEGVAVGPLIDERAMQRMADQVEDAVARGAKLETGGRRLTDVGLDAGCFYAPTVLSGVTPDMRIYREETFGPIAPVVPFDTEEEAIAAANDTRYGLASYVYTRNLDRAFRVTEQLRFGMVGVNDINPTAAAAPFGGVGDSGTGREGALEGLQEYVDVKLVGVSLT